MLLRKSKGRENTFKTLYNRGPQPPGCRPVLVLSLIGTGLHSRRWVVGEQAKLHLLLPIAHMTTWTIPPIAHMTAWTIPPIAHMTAWTISQLLTLLPEPSPPHSVCGKIVFHATGPWCQKVWGPLLYDVYWYRKFTLSVYKMNYLSLSTYINNVLYDTEHCGCYTYC